MVECADTRSMSKPSGSRKTSIGVLFWIAFILLVLVIFLANRGNIEQVLETTGIVEVIRDRFGGADPTPDAPATPDPEEPTPQPVEDPRVTIEERPSVPQTPPAADPPPQAQPESPSPDPAQPQVPQRQTPAQRAPSPDPEKPNRLMAGLYFIRVTEDGRTYPQRVVRPVYYDSGPLTETINALLAGPTGEELKNGLLNTIPEGTRLISAHVQNGTAYLNFNQAFRFNALGAEGTVAQLLQIIYSSTEFPTVERVQFLVDGERIDYLGGDGIFVGEPLGRNAFSS